LTRAKHIPIRTCIGCGEKKPKGELLRIVKTPEGTLTIDLAGKKGGRGTYICFNLDCLEKAIKKKSLQRSLKVNEIDRDLLERLKELLPKVNK